MKKGFLLTVALRMAVLLSCKKKNVSYEEDFNVKFNSIGFEYRIRVYKTAGDAFPRVFYVLDEKDLMPIIKNEMKKIKYRRRLRLLEFRILI